MMRDVIDRSLDPLFERQHSGFVVSSDAAHGCGGEAADGSGG